MFGKLFDVLNARAISAPLSKGSVLFHSGEKASIVYVVRTGKISLVWTGINGVHPMDIREAGSIIGLPGVFNGTYSTAARAVEDSELGWIPADTLMALLECQPDLMQHVTRLLAEEVVRTRAMVGKTPDRKRLRVVRKTDR